MKCDEIEILLSAHIDQEVTEQERRLVESHLEACECCQRKVSAFLEVRKLYRNIPAKEPQPGFRQRVTQRLEKEPRLPFLKRWWRRMPLAYVTSFALLVFVGGVLSVRITKQSNIQVVDVYAEDILFGQTGSTMDDMFSLERTSVADEIVDMFSFDEADNTIFFENSSPSSNGFLYISRRKSWA